MADLSDATRRKALDRDRFMEAGDPGEVRQSILTSWRRSLLCGVTVDSLTPRYQPDIDDDSQLLHAARPVLTRLEDALSNTPMSVVLTDPRARVLVRRAGEPALNKHLDDIMLAPGFSYAEEFVGTNGIGTTIEDGRAAHVFGPEHFSSRLQSVSCAGSPIRNPLNGRLEGVLDLTCWKADANPLMMALVREAVTEIEQRLLEASTERERALLREFLAACRRADRPIVTVNDDLVIANAQASYLLNADDHLTLRAWAADLVGSGRRGIVQVSLSDGRRATLHCRPVASRAGTAGAVVEISLQAPSVGGRAVSGTPLPGLAGQSPAWLEVCGQVLGYARGRTPVLICGEVGVGKVALAGAAYRRWFPASRLSVIDADELAADAVPELVAANGALVLRHLDRLGALAARALADLLAAASNSFWLVGTMPAGASLDPSLQSPFAASVTVPPLRHRIVDVRDLVPALLRRMAPGRTVTCAPEAMQALLRLPWPGNVAQLEEVLRSALARRRTNEIRLEDLPEECHTRSRRVLTQWETLERDAITKALLEAGGDKAKAAAALGLSRATIYRKISAYGIRVDGSRS